FVVRTLPSPSASPPPTTHPLSLHDALPIFSQFKLYASCLRLSTSPSALSCKRPTNPPPRLSDRNNPPSQQTSLAMLRPQSLGGRSEEHTSELQSRESSYAVLCWKKKKRRDA